MKIPRELVRLVPSSVQSAGNSNGWRRNGKIWERRVWSLGFRVWSLGFRVSSLGFRVWRSAPLGFKRTQKASSFDPPRFDGHGNSTAERNPKLETLNSKLQ